MESEAELAKVVREPIAAIYYVEQPALKYLAF